MHNRHNIIGYPLSDRKLNAHAHALLTLPPRGPVTSLAIKCAGPSLTYLPILILFQKQWLGKIHSFELLYYWRVAGSQTVIDRHYTK